MLWERGKVKGTRKGTFATVGCVCVRVCMKESVFDSSAGESERESE